MTTGLPRGSGPREDPGAATLPGAHPRRQGPVVVVVSAPWAGPSRPAPTVLRELGRRWGAAARVLIVEDPSEELLERWGIDVLPTWLRFQPSSGADGERSDEELLLPELTGTDLEGALVTLEGPWLLQHRRTGAQPKHVIDAEFGPQR